MSDTEYDAAVAAALTPEPAQAARVGFDAAVDTNPDAYAEARRVARRTGVPVDTALALPKDVARQAALGTIDFDALAKTAPATARLIADHDRARLAHDNVDNMGELERKLRQFGGGALEGAGMEVGGTGQLLDIAQRNTLGGLANLILPRPMARGQATNESVVGPLIGEDWRTVGGAIKRTARDDVMVPAASQTFGDKVAAGLGQVFGQILMLPFTRGAGLYAQGADAMAEKIAPDIDASQGRQDLAVLGGAAITGITEKWALDRLLGPLAVPIKNRIGSSLARIGVAAAAEGGQEFTENVLQDTLRVVLTNPDAPIDIGQSVEEGGVGATVGGIVRSIVEAGLHIRTRGARAEVGQQQAAELIGNLNRLAAADKVLARDPETFEQWVAEATEDGPVGQVFVDARALMQSGVAEQIAELSPAVAEQLQTALETGGAIAIPIEEYTARIAPTEFSAGLLDHLKVDPEGFSRAEAQEYMQSGMAAEFEAEVDRTLAEKEGNATFKASADAVKAEVKGRLDAVKRFRPDVNDAYATMVGSFYAVTAAKVGGTPEELFQRYPLAVSAERVAGTGFDQIAWHGTPHVWPPEPGFPHGRPRLDKMGSGEGAQAYGWGWYSAQAQDVAKGYQTTLTADRGFDFGGKSGLTREQVQDLVNAREGKKYLDGVSLPSGVADRVIDDIVYGSKGRPLPRQYKPGSERAALYQKLVNEIRHTDDGSLYQLDIPDDVMPKLLDWDKPLSEQSSLVRDALKRWAESAAGRWETGRMGERRFVEPGRKVNLALRGATAMTGEAFYGMVGDQKSASEALKALGIPGLRYLDGSSRNKGEGTYNYVIWDQNVLDRIALLERNGEKLDALREADTAARELNQSGDAPRGRFNPDTLTVTLLKGADLSTFLHESGHFFLEVQFDLAEKLRQDAEALGADTLKPGERQLLADTDALLQWFGVPDLATWYSLDFEAKRGHHEKFARGFEAYLFEGKAPSIELHGLFQRFRAWLLRVYRELKNLNVKLTDEVRGTFDRMLATSEQIALAEQGRNMMSLFASAQQAGMTPEEFAEYQALGTKATAQAIDDLQARGMRDMAWSRNARGRAVKRLQKEAREKRAEVEMEVRREVMSQPVYRAWQFLTGKLTADDRIKNPEPPKSSPDVLDETIDSLFVAVAKLGGIDKAEALGTWGIDPADKPQSGVFGKPVWRQDGGLSLDGMAEALAQYGYLDLDPNGKVDPRDFEERFKSELAGSPAYSNAYDYGSQQAVRPGDQLANPQALGAARLAIAEVEAMGLPPEVVAAVKARRMTATNGLHPDVAADIIGDFTSGDELVRALAEATPPRQEIDARTDALMLERFGDLSSPEAIERAADEAIHNDVRARFIATEANALAKATGRPRVLASAAREYARAVIARLKVRNVHAGQYTNAEARAARAAAKAFARGDTATAAVEKRNQVIHNAAARAALNALAEIDRGLRYLRRFDTRTGSLDADYADQIERLLERFDLRKSQSNKAVDKRAALAEWIEAQNDMGLEPDISPDLANEAFRTSYKNLTVEEFRGLVDAVRQIEHLGRLKHRLLTARDKRTYEAIRDELAASIRANANAQGRHADTRTDTRTATTLTGRALEQVSLFWASHIKAATWARVMDGGVDGGPVWEHFVRGANERADREATMRAEATTKLSEILAPVFALGPMGGNGIHFPTIGRSLNRMARLAIALNAGNASNLQRLLGGENWTPAQLQPVLESLSPAEWQAVQAIWDHFESYRPQIADKERRVYGKEPEWVEPRAFTVTASDGTTVAMRGGYYPVKFDPRASQRAEEHADAEKAKRQIQGAYTSATTRHSFTKTRVEKVEGRPLLYTLAGLYSGVNDVIHDLSWHEWLIDTNRLLRSHTVGSAIREHYGPDAYRQIKTWVEDIAEGDQPAANAGEVALGWLRQGVSAAGLGFNVMSAAIQITGFNQSVVRVGARWVGRGVAKYLGGPVELTRKVNQMSSFMENRARTRFRELNELRNRVQGQSAFQEFIGRYAYFMMMRVQQAVDVPTWWGAYEKALAGGADESKAVALADQAVLDAQSGGQTKDLSAIERGNQPLRLFTVFYSFMNAVLNLGVAQTMTADTPKKRAKLAVDYLLLFVVPVVLGYALKNALTPGDSGDDEWGDVAKKMLAEQLSFLFGLMVVVREFAEVGKIVAGVPSFGYQGPAGVRVVSDALKLAQQTRQGEFDDAFRKAFINVAGSLFGLPAAQANRTITGAQALAEGKTDNPAAIAFGFQEAPLTRGGARISAPGG